MSRKILIIDSASTNRIVLRVKMKAAQYDVTASASCAEAAAHILNDTPDLILVNLIDPTEDRFAFIRRLREDEMTANIGIICLGMHDTAKARFAALDAGADDVLPRPISDTLLLARVRNLMRRRNLHQEWYLQEGTSPSFGFEERNAPRLTPAAIALLSDQGGHARSLIERLQAGLGQSIRHLPTAQALRDGAIARVPDLFVIDASGADQHPNPLLQLVSSLHGGSDERFAARLVVVPKTRPDLAALFLDLGADDVVPADAEAEELALRCRTLLQFKAKRDIARERVRDGMKASVTDCLTGLSNRRFAEEQLSRIAHQSHESACDYALLMLDIDHFKAINDTHGHAAGDLVLRQVAERLGCCFRKIDVVSRIGGEEFLIVMPGTSVEQASHAAERLRGLIGGKPFRIGKGSKGLDVTISVGIAVDEPHAPDTPTPAEMIARADAALYAAKASGRNRVELHLAAA